MRKFIKRRKSLRNNRIKKTFKRKALRRAMAVVAKREIAKAAENKVLRGSLARKLGSYPPNYPLFDTRNIIDTSEVLRNLALGTGSGNRIGNKIKLKRYMMKFMLWPNSTSTTPVFVKMWVVSDKLNPTNVTASDIETAMDNTAFQPGGTFFENGNSTSGCLGNFQDLQMDVNRDRFTVHKTRVFKLSVAQQPGTAGNNDFKLNHQFSVNVLKYHPKVIKYQDAITGSWYTRRVFIIFEVINYDDTAAGVGSDAASLSHTANIQYEDM